MEKLKGKFKIAMVSDFFDPSIGGVENHIHQLSVSLVARGNKVIIVTNSHNKTKSPKTNRFTQSSIVWMKGGIKVYRLPLPEWWRGAIIPTIATSSVALLREIFKREQIQVVHTHQNVSTLAHEAICVANLLGIHTIFTDHSLVGFTEIGSILLNGCLAFTLSDVCHTIAVSHTCRENIVLRSEVNPELVSTIPNAFHPTQFLPKSEQEEPTETRLKGKEKEAVTIILLSRLVYRKGIDLAVCAIPEICNRFPQVKFIIGGDGPKRLQLEEMREKYQLEERVELLGEVQHENVRDVLIKGDIFLNCSLTEGFCIAIVEAASCGLLIVSTQVGGIPEVLPPEMIKYSHPTVHGIIEAVSNAIPIAHEIDRPKQHKQVAKLYNWNDVARRTEKVYSKVISIPNESLLLRFSK